MCFSHPLVFCLPPLSPSCCLNPTSLPTHNPKSCSLTCKFLMILHGFFSSWNLSIPEHAPSSTVSGTLIHPVFSCRHCLPFCLTARLDSCIGAFRQWKPSLLPRPWPVRGTATWRKGAFSKVPDKALWARAAFSGDQNLRGFALMELGSGREIQWEIGRLKGILRTGSGQQRTKMKGVKRENNCDIRWWVEWVSWRSDTYTDIQKARRCQSGEGGGEIPYQGANVYQLGKVMHPLFSPTLV